jgi:hypothetical protein
MIENRTLFEYLDLNSLDFLFVGLVEVRSERTKKKENLNIRYKMLAFIFGCESKCRSISTTHCFINQDTLNLIKTTL